jgi:(R)-amidase
MSRATIAIAQLPLEDGRVDANFGRIEAVAKRYGPNHDVVLYPEATVTGFPPPDVAASLAEPLDGPVVQRLTTLAAEVGSVLVAGMLEREGERVYNTSVMVGPEGLLLSYRKTHLWMGEAARVAPGDAFRCRTWNGACWGLLVCYDIEFPETARAVASIGAEVILVTNGNMAPYGPTHRNALRARAQENQVFVAMANRVGIAGNTSYVGESAMANPYGEVMGALGRDEGVLSVSVDTATVHDSRRDYDYLAERRLPIGVEPVTTDGPVRACRIRVGEGGSTP